MRPSPLAPRERPQRTTHRSAARGLPARTGVGAAHDWRWRRFRFSCVKASWAAIVRRADHVALAAIRATTHGPPTIEPSHRSAALPARIGRAKPCHRTLPRWRAAGADHLGTLGGWAGWRGHTAGWSGTPVTGRTRTSGASVSGCASGAAKSPISRSTRGLRSSMSQTSGASRSAGVTGAVRLSHAPCMNGVRGCTLVRSNTSASATPAVAVARRNLPATCHASVDRSAPRRAAANRVARHSLGASTSGGTRFSFRLVAASSPPRPGRPKGTRTNDLSAANCWLLPALRATSLGPANDALGCPTSF
jgi:hypothetical protein